MTSADVLKSREAADMLGVSYPALMDMVRTGEVPAWRTRGRSGQWRFSRQDLAAVLETRRSEAIDAAKAHRAKMRGAQA